MPQTSVRLLRVLSLLQTPGDWTGPQLAGKLGVTTRTIRKDIERLRGLGYPIHAIPGTAGGYRVGPSASMPVPGSAPALDAAVLTIIATACRDREQLRFDYTGHDGTSSYRIVEPYRLARDRGHWYLLGWDTGRRDWRTFRAGRIRLRSPNGPQFARRDSPDDGGAAARVLSGPGSATWRCQARVTVHAPADVIIQQLPPAITVEPLDEHTCVVSAGSDTPQILAAYLGMFDADFEVSEPPELVEHIRTLARRYKRAIAKAPVAISRLGQARSGPRRETGPVVGAEYSPIHSSFHDWSYRWVLQRGWQIAVSSRVICSGPRPIHRESQSGQRPPCSGRPG